MENYGLQINILPNKFLNEDGTFNKDDAIVLSGKIAGICYDKEGFTHLENEPIKKTNRRINMTLNNGHHSVYDHVNISFNIKGLPKILAMVLNNEHQYTTSEKSARYTPVKRGDGSLISEREEELYNKWIDIFSWKIKEEYGDQFKDSKIEKLAQENARYLVTVFMPTEMVYTTSLRQINYIASWMEEYIDKANITDEFEYKLSIAMREFIAELERLNVLEERLMSNEKHRSISLFGKNLDKKTEIFSDVYCTTYESTFALLAQAQRHRTLDYKIERQANKRYYIPPILLDDALLVDEWLRDIESVSYAIPQGEIIYINEIGKYEDFILKCKERLCSGAQLEINDQVKETLVKYEKSLQEQNHPLAQDIKNYNKGARCTFKDFNCSQDCAFKQGKTLSRKI